MAYTKKNVLMKIVDIQNITLEYQQKGVSQKWIYENVIYPNYRISRTTYYAYLNTPAKRLLRELEKNEGVSKENF